MSDLFEDIDLEHWNYAAGHPASRSCPCWSLPLGEYEGTHAPLCIEPPPGVDPVDPGPGYESIDYPQRVERQRRHRACDDCKGQGRFFEADETGTPELAEYVVCVPCEGTGRVNV